MPRVMNELPPFEEPTISKPKSYKQHNQLNVLVEGDESRFFLNGVEITNDKEIWVQWDEVDEKQGIKVELTFYADIHSGDVKNG